MRVGYRRVVAVIENKKMSRAYFILTYLITYSLLALIASNSQVSVDYPRGIAILLFLLFLATTTVNFEILVKLPGQLFLIMLGLSGLVFSLNLLVNFSIAKNLTIVLHPGIIGGILLLMVQILYLPNLFFSTFSYILGSGFSLGSATDITPFIFNLREIPAIPVLAALPAGKFPWIITLSIMLFVYALINLNKIKALDIDKKSKQQLYLRFLIISVLGSAILAFVSSGSLISANMNPVGVNPLRIGAIVFGHILLAFLVTQYFPKLFKKKDKQSRLTT
jgi:hypothetical protein